MKFGVCAALFAAALTFAGSSATAAIMVGKVTGSLTADSMDILGDFGSAGSLAGEGFTLDFVYDTDLFVVNVYNGAFANGESGSGYGSPGHFTSMVLTIKGVAKSLETGERDQVSRINPVGYFALSSRENLFANTGDFISVNSYGGSTANADLASPYNSSTPTCCGTFQIAEDGVISSAGRLSVATFTVGAAPPGAPVPEPQAWSLMLLGFGALGGLLRTKRRSAARLAPVA